MIFPEESEPFLLPMSKDRLRWNLECIGWSPGELARRLDVNERSMLNWLSGKKVIPDRVAVWIETVRALITALPAPPFWRDLSDLRDVRHQTLERLERVYSVPSDTQELLRARQKVIAKWWDELDEEGRRYWTKQARTENPEHAWLFYRRVIEEDLRKLGGLPPTEADGSLS